MIIIAFHAHRQEIDEGGFTLDNYSQVAMPHTTPDAAYTTPGYNLGDRYDNDNSSWKPVQTGEPDALVQFSGQLWLPEAGALGAGDYYVARIIKNGYPGVSIGAKICAKGAFAGDWVIDLSMQDIATAEDIYKLYLFVNLASAYVNGCSLHSWWCGAKVAA